MNSREADEIARVVCGHLEADDSVGAFTVLKSILNQRTPFSHLDRIAAAVTHCPWKETSELLELIAQDGSEGGWVLIGSCLRGYYPARTAQIVDDCRRYIVAADSWYGADILGERVPGPALVSDFEPATGFFLTWRSDGNRWVRRSIGVAAHYWAKRSRGDQALAGQAETLLDFLELMFEEWDMDAVKGIGWGLKTLGRYYPESMTPWLLAQRGRPHRRLLLRKAVTYLPEDQRRLLLEAYGL
jgi:hypothetical protein